MDTSAARTEILRRIRTAIATPAATTEMISTQWQALDRSYNAVPKHPRSECVALFEDRLRDLLPDPVPVVSEADTGSFPAITDAMPVTSHRRS